MKIVPWLASFSLAASALLSGPASPRFAAAAPDNTLGMAVLAANVFFDGTLLNGSGVTAAGRTPNAQDGSYDVDFNRDVSGCFYSATNSGWLATPLNAVALPFQGDNPKRVRVMLFNNANNTASGSFYLLVYCAK
jgi:hypothetical protein